MIRRRFYRGLRNLFGLYATIADEWSIYDATQEMPRVVYEFERQETVHDQDIYERIRDAAN